MRWLVSLLAVPAIACAIGDAVDPASLDVESTTGQAGSSSEDGESTSGAPDEPDRADLGEGSTSGAGTTGSGPDAMPIDEPRVRVHPGETDDAELVQKLPVAQNENDAERRVVLRLGPDALPDLASGDVLVTPAEVQVTTRCDVGQVAPGCDYDPTIRAQIVVRDGEESAPLSEVQTQTCTKAEHHCMFVFRPAQATATIEGALELPCVADGTCKVELVMWAWDGNARPGGVDEVIVGANEGNFLDNGIVEGDRARLMAVRERAIADDDREHAETTGGGSLNVPTNASPTLVYSHPLASADEGLVAGEQFVVEARIVAMAASRARFSTEVFLSKEADAVDGNGLEKTAPQQIGEHNGINCTPGDNPCVTKKVAVFAVTEDIPGPVHVNVVVRSAVPGGGSTQVTVDRGEGWVRSTRYDAAHEG